MAGMAEVKRSKKNTKSGIKSTYVRTWPSNIEWIDKVTLNHCSIIIQGVHQTSRSSNSEKCRWTNPIEKYRLTLAHRELLVLTDVLLFA